MKGKITLIFGAVLVLLLVAAAMAFSFKGNTPADGKNYDAFAQCLTERGAAMYGAEWCSHCQNQKRMFGESFRFVNYVECTEEIRTCTEKGIQGFPTWVFADNSRLEGEQSFAALAAKSGCPLP